MRRRDLLTSFVRAGCVVAAAPMVNRGRFALRGAPGKYSARAIELVTGSVVVDALGLLTLDWGQLARWQNDPASLTEGQVRLLRSSCTTVFHPAVEMNERDPASAAESWLARWNRFVSARSDVLVRIDTAACLGSAKARGRIGVLLGIQNSTHFHAPADVERFYSLGQRISQLTYDCRNGLGGGCGDARDRGLSPFGADIVAAMNRCGMAVDVSHAGERTTLDAIAASRAPVLVTHANCRALMPHPRCKSDRVLRALAAGGGVIGLTGLRPFVGGRDATLADLLDHFDHAVRIAGPEHVAIGTDSEPAGRRIRLPGSRRPFTVDVAGFDHPLRLFDLVEGLLARGYSDQQIRGILGGNFLRSFIAIENTRI